MPEEPNFASCSETNSNVSPQPSGGTTGLPLPDVSGWTRWVLGPVFLFAIPLCKKILRTEEVVEKSVEAASEEAERVAELVKKVAADVANDLPGSGGLRKVVLRIEEVADMVIVYAEEAEAFIHKVVLATPESNPVVAAANLTIA
ncbi:hypothetical protein Taro_006438 [Colocasia esculenta]|uniref:Uncharacterized protein n=1 Tax=Colocasia esculenta TaxID=4460 RepID=A0A843TSH4_COLES|nr:hypothetical protein [Colocasia esculenta]